MPALIRMLVYVAALVFVTKRRKLIRTLRRAWATDADRAIPLETTGLSTWWLHRLCHAGVIRQTPGGQYWLDPVAYGRYRRVRIVRVAVVLAVAIAAWVVWSTSCCGL